jgi:aspartate/tyrosine/aromatic aminotransferase
MAFFDNVEMADPDPILSLNSMFADDTRSEKINLGVGAYKTAELKPLVFAAVKKAEARLASGNQYKEYLPIDGDKEFLACALELVFGKGAPILEEGRVFAAQALGGTGALRVGAEFLKKEVSDKVFLSDPSWANHKPLFTRAGHKVDFYPYLDRKKYALSFKKMCDEIKNMEKGNTILLHGCCHNPTGIDPSLEQWKELSVLIKEQGLVPFFDLAYQGFGEGVEEDVKALRTFVDDGHELLVAYSFSKNFGLYGERVGALFVVTSSDKVAERVGSKIKTLIRTNYSNPPCHGARIIKTILKSDELTQEWKRELNNMRERVVEMRKCLASELIAKSSAQDFSFMNRQKGIFSFSGLDKDQVEALKVEFGIYMPANGRINVAGLSSQNLEYLVDAILATGS